MSNKLTVEEFQARGPSSELRRRSALDGNWVPIKLLNPERRAGDHDSGPAELLELVAGYSRGQLAMSLRGEPNNGSTRVRNVRIFLADATECAQGEITTMARDHAWALGMAGSVFCNIIADINGGRRVLVDLAHHSGRSEDLSAEFGLLYGLWLVYDPYLLNSQFFPEGAHPFMRDGPVGDDVIAQLRRPTLQQRVHEAERLMLIAIAEGHGIFAHEGWVPPGIWRNNSPSRKQAWNELLPRSKAKQLLSQ